MKILPAVNCQFCNYQIILRSNIQISHAAMQMAAHIMTHHTHWEEDE